MAVRTPVSRKQLEIWLTGTNTGQLTDFRGIATGIENTNYFVDTSKGQFVLTLFETLPSESLNFYLDLQARLAASGFPCPQPIPDHDGTLHRPLADKPAALLTRLPGRMPEAASSGMCSQIGSALARLHQFQYPGKHPYPIHSRNALWRKTTARQLTPHLPPAEQELLIQALERDQRIPWPELPQGLIHADLFRDNTLWQGQHLSGILDFYFAGHDALLFDLAVAANDWTNTPQGQLAPTQVAALLSGYQSVRSLSSIELAVWPDMLAVAALRFWLSRLVVQYLSPTADTGGTAKDPEQFRAILACHLQNQKAI